MPYERERAVEGALSATSTTMKYLNLGCGARVHPAWTNVDIAPQAEGVIACNLRASLPFADATFGVVYHSHLLEHFSHQEARTFLRECFRVLEPGGVVRVVVPDLEQIARLYLEALERAAEGDGEWRAHYDWLMLELYDQTVRECSGGDMRQYLEAAKVPNETFVLQRIGVEGQRLLAAMRAAKASPALQDSPPSRARKLWMGARRRTGTLRQSLLRFLLREDWEALQIGRFRLSGEIHRWMYDRYSLGQMLIAAGFASPRRVDAAESKIADWASYGLDVEPDGSVYKPDSLFMEATKPLIRSEPIQPAASAVHSSRQGTEGTVVT